MIRLSPKFQQFFRHEGGWTFTASFQPIEDMKIYNDDYFPVRQILRVTNRPDIVAGQIVQDNMGQRYLLGDYDRRPEYTAFRAFPVNRYVPWQRVTSVLDPLTKMPRGTNMVLIKSLWVLSEIVNREERGGDIKTREEVKRVITGAPVLLGDSIDGEPVKKVNPTLGLYVLEV